MVAVFLGNVGAARQVLGFFSVCLGLVGGCGPDLLAGMAEGLRHFGLRVQFPLYLFFVKPVVQAACIGLGTLRRRVGVYLGTGFFRRQPGLPNLTRFVGDLEVARVDAAAGNALLSVAVVAFGVNDGIQLGRLPAFAEGNVPSCAQGNLSIAAVDVALADALM